MRTIEVLTNNMVKPSTDNKILFERYKEVNPNNMVSLLLVARQMYGTQKEATNLLRLVAEVE